MRDIIRWVSEARPDKEIGVGMTHYRVAGGEIRATNGKLTVSHPWPEVDASFLASGAEFERVLSRMGDGGDVAVEADLMGGSISVRGERFSATIATLPVEMWAYGGVDDAVWNKIPSDFVEILRSLRAFISDKPTHEWAGCVAVERGNMYATNNVALAGAACDVGEVETLLHSSAVDFLLRRTDDLAEWTCNDNYSAFRWESGAWMRTQRVHGKFPERAAEMVRGAYDSEPTQEITDDFRDAFADVAALAEDAIRVYADRIESKYKRSVMTAPAQCEVPPGAECSLWGAAILTPVISQATRWQPSLWPKPAPFRGESIAGLVAGRKDE